MNVGICGAEVVLYTKKFGSPSFALDVSKISEAHSEDGTLTLYFNDENAAAEAVTLANTLAKK